MLIFNYGNWSEWEQQLKVTFDPYNKLIIINDGVFQLDAQIDLYSVWKRWLTYYDNAKYEAAFRTFGGDQTGENQFAPRYFFLINGWKIFAKNVSTVVQMNLYSDDGASPFIIDNSAITNRASDVPIIKSETDIRLQYGDRIYYDETSEYSGTSYPNGTIAQPINNIPDAIQLGLMYNIYNFYCLSDVNITNTGNVFENYSIYADKENLKINIIEGNYLNNIYWEGFTINANFGGGFNKFVNCKIENAIDVTGEMVSCQMVGLIKIWDSLVCSLCFSGIAGSLTPVWDMNENRPTSLSIRSYSGGVEILNCSFLQDTATIELIAGQIKLSDSCTSGYIDIRGVGYLTDNSSGATIKTTGFIDSFEEYIEQNIETDQRLIYSDRIYYDETSIYTGTTYPVGTILQPVNNPIDAITLANIYNIKTFNVLSDTDFYSSTGNTLNGYIINSLNINNKIVVSGNTLNNFTYINFILTGNLGGINNTIIDCNILRLDEFRGVIKGSKLIGNISFIGDSDIINSYSGDDLHTSNKEIPSIELISDSGVILNIRNYSGDLILNKMEHVDDDVTIDLISGNIIIESGCTDGTITIRGVGSITNNSSGTTVISDGFVSQSLTPEDVEKLTGLTETISIMTDTIIVLDNKVTDISGVTYEINEKMGVISSQVKRILGLSQENFRIMEHTYTNNNLDSAIVKIYDSSEDCNNDENPISTYTMNALYDSSGRLVDYKVIKD